MSKEIYISSTPHETRLAIVEDEALTEIYYERENEYTLAGSIYNGKVTRVLPGMQSSFVDIGLERDAFLYITDFMEEAGDSAEFEQNANGGDHQRAPRREGRGQDRNGDRGSDRNQDRGFDRNQDRSGDRNARREAAPRQDADAPPAEMSDEEMFRAAVDGSFRPAVNGNGDQRRRGRGQRDGRPRDAREAAPADSRPLESTPESSRLDLPAGEDAAELGEAAPGADGSRRWRGRRGRRGSRGGERREGTPAAATGPLADAYDAPIKTFGEPAEFFEEPSILAPAHGKAGLDLDASAETQPLAYTRREERGERSRGRGGRGRGSRDERAADPEAPFYDRVHGAVPAGYGDASEAPAEPIILPGESLSKYRPASEQPQAETSSAAVAPAPEFRLAGAWDGGSVLPGETLRRRDHAPTDLQASHSGDRPYREARNDRGERGRDRGSRDGGRRDGGRHDRSDTVRSAPVVAEPIASVAVTPAPARNFRTGEPSEVLSRPHLVEFPTPQQTADAVPAADVLPAAAAMPAELHPVDTVDSTFVPPPPAPAAAEAEQAAIPIASDEPTTPQEYEPTEAAASYRVDPGAPREYRQAAAVAETAPAEAHFDGAAAREEAHGEPTPALHEITSISAAGDMLSEPLPAVDAFDGSVQAPVPQAEQAQVAHTEPLPSEPHAAWPPPAFATFEPGTGLLEEETLDDEEETQPLESLHAAHPTEHEHEALVHAADLGTMLREMSIDQRTLAEPAESDAEDLDEDFLEEDQLEGDEDFDSLEDSEENDDESFTGDDAEEPEGFGEPAQPGGDPDGQAAGSEEGAAHEARRRDDRGRRDGRRGDRGRRERQPERAASDRNGADRNGSERIAADRGGDRGGSDRGRRGGRQSMQTTNLPAISDLLKPGQEILVQIAKEPIAKKGARITSHIALPGRFLVFMPTVSHTGVSRKIESDGERRRLKEILLSEKGEAAGGFIVRTAAAGASEEELRSDLRFLLNLWNDIKARSDSSKSPALIYHDLNLVERVLRDQVTDNFSAIWVDTESQYEQVLRFLQRFQPSLIRRVKLYTKETPLFEQFGITEEINKALRSKVWLKSGGSIVINQTEALVAIDINTGKYVGKTARLEDTIVKTNLDAIPEIVRQIRLRDLGGIIIIDFIDMDERKNRNRVMAALEEELKQDRAPSKVLQFNDFGLVAITRKRVKQSLERTLSTTCGVCAGTGMVKSPVTVANDIYVEMRKMHKHLDRGDVMLRVHPEVVKQLKSGSARWLQEMEEMVGKTILVKSDPSLHPEQFDIH